MISKFLLKCIKWFSTLIRLRICVFTQLKCLKKQLKFIGWRNKKQWKSSIPKGKNTGAYRPISLLGGETSVRRMVPDSIKIREPVLVMEEKNKYSLHEFPKFDWLTIIALLVSSQGYCRFRLFWKNAEIGYFRRLKLFPFQGLTRVHFSLFSENNGFLNIYMLR